MGCGVVVSSIFPEMQQTGTNGSKIQTLNYSVSGDTDSDSFKSWQQLLASLFRVTRPFHRREHGFFASLTVYHLGLALVLHGKSDAVRYSRSDAWTLRDDLDHLFIHVCSQGGGHLRRAGENRRLNHLDVGIVDLASPLDFVAYASESVSLVLPRSLLSPTTGELDRQHGRILLRDTPVGGLLGQHIVTLCQTAPRLWLHEAVALARVTANLADTCLGIGAVSYPAPTTTSHGGLMRSIRGYIEARLHQPDLAPEEVASAFLISRSQLYRLFETSGGVRHYISRRRLRRALLDICSPALRHRRIGDIAYDLGFRNEAHFSRIFHDAFGSSPRAARAASKRGDAEWLAVASPAPGGNQLEHWLKELMAG
nr:helix-turn-helix domain-containing protein [Aminobacter niigataensis]WMD00530.1 helix-turn-helix domain-containing protein [Aminobacter niigataensis]